MPEIDTKLITEREIRTHIPNHQYYYYIAIIITNYLLHHFDYHSSKAKEKKLIKNAMNQRKCTTEGQLRAGICRETMNIFVRCKHFKI